MYKFYINEQLTDNIDEIKKYIHNLLNQLKEQEKNSLTVKYNGAVFQADKESRDAAAQSYFLLNESETIKWLDINNQWHTFTKEQLKEAFAQVKDRIQNIIAKYINLKNNLSNLEKIKDIIEFLKNNDLLNYVKIIEDL